MYTTVHLFCKLEAVLSALRKTFSQLMMCFCVRTDMFCLLNCAPPPVQ